VSLTLFVFFFLLQQGCNESSCVKYRSRC